MIAEWVVWSEGLLEGEEDKSEEREGVDVEKGKDVDGDGPANLTGPSSAPKRSVPLSCLQALLLLGGLSEKQPSRVSGQW